MNNTITFPVKQLKLHNEPLMLAHENDLNGQKHRFYQTRNTTLGNSLHKLRHPRSDAVSLKTDGTGRSIPHTAGGHIVALMTKQGGRRDSLTGDDRRDK